MRGISLSAHSAFEMIAAPAIMAAPFVLGLGVAATIVAGLLGVTLLGLSLQAESPQRSVPLSAHAGFDYALAALALVGGLVIGAVTGDWHATVFLVGVGAAMVALTASTRFSGARGA